MGIAEDLQELNDQLAEQRMDAGGRELSVFMIRILLRAVRGVWQRADARADALEARIAAIEARLPQ